MTVRKLNFFSHKNLKQPMLDQCLNTIIAYILQPWTVYMQQKSGSNPPSKYQETFTACTGIIRNLSSYSWVANLKSSIVNYFLLVLNRILTELVISWGIPMGFWTVWLILWIFIIQKTLSNRNISKILFVVSEISVINVIENKPKQIILKLLKSTGE